MASAYHRTEMVRERLTRIRDHLSGILGDMPDDNIPRRILTDVAFDLEDADVLLKDAIENHLSEGSEPCKPDSDDARPSSVSKP